VSSLTLSFQTSFTKTGGLYEGETCFQKTSVFEIKKLSPKVNDKKEVNIRRKHNLLIGFPVSNFFHTSFTPCERSHLLLSQLHGFAKQVVKEVWVISSMHF
jgi:hypothetical protein